MNILDLIVILVIIYSGLRAYYKGFLYTVFQTLSTIIALGLSYFIYKPVNIILRKTFLYGWLQEVIIGQLANRQEEIGLKAQTQLINQTQLPVPTSIKEHLIRQNNPEVYSLLGANNFIEYIGSYIANFLLNMIAFMLVWCIVKIIIYIISESIQIIRRLPIINVTDKWFGLALGLAKGVLGVFISTIILAVLIPFPKFQGLVVLLNQSVVAKWFYENNIILNIIDQLFI